MPITPRDQKRVSSINSQKEQPTNYVNLIEEGIIEYLELCKADAQKIFEEKRNSLGNSPAKNHLIPEFILRNFVCQDGSLRNKLIVNEYKQFPSGKSKLIENKQGVTPKGYSTQKNFYSVNDFYEKYENLRKFNKNDKFRMERLLSIIESNAAPMLKKRQEEKFYSSQAINNPYFYPEDIFKVVGTGKSKKYLDDSTGRRIVLSVFFAAQYLRSNFTYNLFSQHKYSEALRGENYSMYNKEEFSDFIEALLPMLAIDYYQRAWRWINSEYDLLVPSGTALVNFSPSRMRTTLNENYLFMPIGRKTGLIILPRNSFRIGHDEVLRNKSIGVNQYMLTKLLTAAILDSSNSLTNKDGSKSAFLAGHPEAKLSPAFNSVYEKDPSLTKKANEVYANAKDLTKDFSFLSIIPRI